MLTKIIIIQYLTDYFRVTYMKMNDAPKIKLHTTKVYSGWGGGC